MATRAHTVPRFYLSGFTAPGPKADHDPFVWLGSLATGMIERRSPKNISIARGYYDGNGGFEDSRRSIENHLATIESEAAFAIRRFVASPIGGGMSPSPEIWRFLSWQAARTPGWFKLVEEWMNDCEPGAVGATVEPPPVGFESIRDQPRSHLVENPNSGERRTVADLEELQAYWKLGWKWTPTTQDRLEMLHMQAWYFQVRHFPRLTWKRLDTPADDSFVTSDRAVAWLVDGYADTPPAALRHPTCGIFGLSRPSDIRLCRKG